MSHVTIRAEYLCCVRPFCESMWCEAHQGPDEPDRCARQKRRPRILKSHEQQAATSSLRTLLHVEREAIWRDRVPPSLNKMCISALDARRQCYARVYAIFLRFPTRGNTPYACPASILKSSKNTVKSCLCRCPLPGARRHRPPRGSTVASL